MQRSYFVRAIWDAEASVWVSQSNVPGLVIEANTLSEFESLVEELAPQMLTANVKGGGHGAPLKFTAERELAIV